MTSEERADLLARLAAGRDALAAALDGMTDAEAAARGPEGRWSALDNVEHVTLGEALMMRGVAAAVPIPGESAPGRENLIFARAQTRVRKVNAPEGTHPSGEYRTVAAALARFDEVRARTVAFVETCTHDLRLCPTTHPLMGPLTCMECLALIAAHPFRHAAQIRELRGIAGTGGA